MNQVSVQAWLMLVMILSVPTILGMLILAPTHYIKDIDPWFKGAMLLITFGLIVQCIRSTHFFLYGSYPIDNIFPMWVTKDVGGIIFIVRTLYLRMK